MASVCKSSVNTGFRACAVVSVARVDWALFRTNNKEGWISGWKAQTRWRKVFSLSRGWSRQFEIFLGLGKHVNTPGADYAVGGGGEDVVRVRSPNYADIVDWMGVTK